MSPLTFDLEQLLGAWKTRLQEWSADGSLVAAAREALLLSEVPQELERLAGQWALGDFSGLPPIEVLEGTVLPGAAGAYAISTGTIYLNGDWLASASDDWLIQVLTEELGHHLDGLLNAEDTPGDEGELMALLIDHAGHQPIGSTNSLATEDDSNGIDLPSGQVTLVEQSSLPGSTFSIGRYSGNNKFSDGPEGIKLWFFITRSGSTFGSRSLNVATASGTATSGVDYIPLNTTVHFAPGETSKEIYVETLEDLAQEGNERFTVNISRTSVSDIIANPSSYGEIRNLQFVNQNPVPRHPSLAANYGLSRLSGPNGDSWGVEGSNLWFRIYRYGNISSSGAVRFFTTDDTARAGLDFKGSDLRVDFAAGQEYRDVYVETFSDAISEGTERFFVNIVKYYDVDRVANPTVFGEIYNQPGSIVQPTTYSVSRIPNIDGKNSDGTEGSSLWFRVTRAGNIASSGAVNFSTSSGTARSGFDFRAFNGRINFLPGETTKDVSIVTTTDLLSEPAERFSVSITKVNSNDTIGTASTYGEILNASVIPQVDSIDLDTTISQKLSYNNLTLQSGQSKRFKFRLPDKIEQADRFSVESYGLHFRRSDGSTSGFTLYDANGAKISSLDRVPAGATVTVEVSNPDGALFNGSFDAFLWKVNGKVYDSMLGQAKEVSIKKQIRDRAYDEFQDHWIFSHGWNGNTAKQGEFSADGMQLSEDSSLYKLATELNELNGEAILVDWGTAAYSPGFAGTAPQSAARWISDVASFVTHSVVNVWNYRSKLNLVGHSLGAYLSSEIARLVSDQPATKNYKVDRLIALDPADWALAPYQISNNRSLLTLQYESRVALAFRDVAQYSLALWGKLDILQSIPPFEATGDGAGKGESARTANHSVQVDFSDNDAYANHGYIIDLYRNLIDRNPSTPSKIRNYFDLRQPDGAFLQSSALDEVRISGIGVRGQFLDQTILELLGGFVSSYGFYYTVAKGIDGYLVGGLVHIDYNNNSLLDADEPSLEIAPNGLIQLSLDAANLARLASLVTPPLLILSPNSSALDISTGLALQTLLSAPFGSKVITPLTTLVSELIRVGSSIEQARQLVTQSLGISSGVRLTEFDPLAAIGQGDANAYIVFAKAAAVQNIVTQITSFLKSPSGLVAGPLSFKVFSSIASRLSAEPIDLTQVDVILEIINSTVNAASITLSPELVRLFPEVAAIIAEGQQRLASIIQPDPYQYLDEVGRIQQVSQGLVAAALSRLSENPSDPDWNSTQFSGQLLEQLISSAQLLNLLPPTVSPSIFSIQEVPFDQPSGFDLGSAVGTIQAFDPEGQEITFGLDLDPSRFSILDLDGDGINAFAIDSATGDVTVADLDDLDFERQSVFSLLVTASDGLLSTSAPLTINLTDVVDQPVPVANVNDGSASFILSGDPVVGQDLSVELAWDDPDSGSLGITREWQSSSDRLTWDVIEQNVSTFTITPFEEGKHIRVAISYIDGQGFGETVFTDPQLIPFVDDGDADFLITGTPSVGQALSAFPAAEDPDGFGSFIYAWQSSENGTDWSSIGTNDSFYALSVSEEGKQVRVLVTYTDGQGFSEAITTDAVSVPFVDEADAVFSISGTPAVGAILAASRTADDPDGNGVFSYQWQASSDGNTWQPVGTGAATYQLTSAEQGKQVRVLVAYTDGEGFTEQVQTSPVAVPFVNDGAAVFSINGTSEVGSNLTASLSTADPDGNGVFSYQWQASSDGNTWQPVGTGAATYQLTAAEQGKQMRVLVAYTDGEGFTEQIQTSPVAVPFVNDGAAVFSISGTPAVGAILTASRTADDPDGNGLFSYQWEASSDGSTWQPVGTGATTYQLTAAEQGKQVRVLVSYSDGQGFSEAVTTPLVTVPQSSRTPTITAVVDNLGLVSGVVARGGTTNDRTPTINGTLSGPLVRGESLRIFNGATLLGIAKVNNAAGTWSYTPTLPITSGSNYAIVARVSDAAGNLGAASLSFDFLLDTTAPATTASISRLTDDVGWIQGNVRSSGHTDDVTPTISGLLSAPLLGGESLLLFNGTSLLGQAMVNNTELTWSFVPNLPVSTGTTYSIVARVSDAAGNLGSASPTYRFQLDTAVPSATAAITAVSDNMGSVNGNVAPGGATNDRTPTISGTLSSPLASGETLRIFADGTLLGTATVNNTTRTWSYTPTLPSTPGTSYSITARVVDAAGNLGAVSEARTFTLDSIAPATTVAITAVTDDVGLIQGAVASGRRTDDPTPTISGTLSAPLADGEVLQVFRGSTWVGSASVNNTAQTWSFTPTLAATAGTSYSFTARVADAVGNLGPVSNTRSFILDTTAPATTATIAAVTDNFGLLQGSISPGDRTDDRSPTFTGALSGPLASGETLLIFDGSTLLGSATVNNTARTWSFTPNLPATSGTPYAITASVADAAGNLGPASDAFSFTLDTTPNPITGTTNDDLLTLTSAADLVTGLEGSDTIVLPRLTDSLLGTATAPTFDHITDLITGVDRIDAPVARTHPTAVNPVVLGSVTDLTSSGIAAVLSAAVFPALTTTSSGGAATFTFNDPLAGIRTFLAINNGSAGFSATTDAIVEITGFSGTLSQLQVF